MKIDRVINTRVNLMIMIATTTTMMMTTMMMMTMILLLPMMTVVRARMPSITMVINRKGAVLPTPTPPLISSWGPSRMTRETLMTMIAKKMIEVEGKVVVLVVIQVVIIMVVM